MAALLMGWTAALWWQATNTAARRLGRLGDVVPQGAGAFPGRDGARAFFTDAHYVHYAHLDYPLLVPLTIAQTYAWTGDYDPLMKGWWALLAGAAAGGLYWGLAGLTGRVARLGGLVLVLGLPELVKHATGYYAGYADLPLAVLFLFGALFLYRWLRRPVRRAFALAALFFGLAGLHQERGAGGRGGGPGAAGRAGAGWGGRLTWVGGLAARAATG